MDIKKPDSPIPGTNPVSASKQIDSRHTGSSHNQSSPVAEQAKAEKNTLAQTLKAGQTLELQVLKITNSTAFLEVTGSDIKLHTRDKDFLKQGQKLSAQIIQTRPTVELKILSAVSAEAKKTQTLINKTLRQQLPQQQSLQDLIRHIQLLTKPDNALQNIKNSFIQSSPPSQAFEEAQVLPQIFKRSGLFTENLLAKMLSNPEQQTTFPNNDLKISLLRLATQLRALQTQITEKKTTEMSAEEDTSTAKTTGTEEAKENITKNIKIYSPELVQQNQKKIAAAIKHSTLHHNHNLDKNQLTENTHEQLISRLLHLTEGTIAKLQIQQLQQHHLADSQKPAWLFELPVRTDSSLDAVTIYINKDDSKKDSHYLTPWTLVIKLSMEQLGEVQANVSLRGNKISVVFWLEQQQTSLLFSRNLELLVSKLNKTGLETDQIKCHCDKPPAIPTLLPTSTLNENI